MKEILIGWIIGWCCFALFNWIAILPVWTEKGRKEIRKEAVENGFGEFKTDGEKIQFEWITK